jgi:beta-glucosidase
VDFTVAGGAPPPHRVLGTPVRAADFDDHDGVRLVDETRERGDAVAVGPGVVGDLLFRDCDLGTPGRGAHRCLLRVAGTPDRPGAASVQVIIDDVVAGQAVPRAGLGRYEWRECAVDVTSVPGVHDVRLRMLGPVRLAAFTFSDGEP